MRQLLVAAILAIAEPSNAQDSAFKVAMHAAPFAVPDLLLTGADGVFRGLADHRGRYILANVWPTWGASCREELPTLDALQNDLGSPGFDVIALSTDTDQRTAVDCLFAEVAVSSLDPIIDDTGSAMCDLEIFALPATLLIDENAREVGRKVGPAEWVSPEAVAFFASFSDP